MILIEKTTLIRFDDVAERERIECVFKGKVKDQTRKDLLAILDAFVAGDLAECYKLILPKDSHWLEYLNDTVYQVIAGVHEQFTNQAESEELKSKAAAGEPTSLPFGCGFETVAYPKFQFLAEGQLPIRATVPTIKEVPPMFKNDANEPQ